MVSPDLSEFQKTAREIVRDAMLEGTLSNLTIRKVRDKIETAYELEKGFLLTPQYKHSLKAVIQDASAQARKEMKDEVQSRQTMAGKTDVTDGVDYTLTAKALQAGKYKSAVLEFVEDSSDLEELPENNLTRVSPETRFTKGKIESKEPQISLKSPLKKRQKTIVHDNEGTVSGQALTNSESKTKDSDDSDDELASILDDNPKPKKKVRTSGDKSRMKTISSSKSKGEVSDKHNAMIKRLKSLVHACGVRKSWVKEFKDMPKPTQQIKKLREILTELGMTGRMSMEQAKRIKAERDLAQELEDVKSFEQSMLKSSRSRIAESSLRPSLKPTHSEDEDPENDDDLKHKRRKIAPSRSIDAFIGSESDDE